VAKLPAALRWACSCALTSVLRCCNCLSSACSLGASSSSGLFEFSVESSDFEVDFSVSCLLYAENQGNGAQRSDDF
jgi:hypothetical protein